MNKRQLYESIMKNVAKQVKKALNEAAEVATQLVKRIVMPTGNFELGDSFEVTGTKTITFDKPLHKYVIYFDRYRKSKHIACIADMIATTYVADDFEDFDASDVIETFDNLEDAVEYALKDSKTRISDIFQNDEFHHIKGYADTYGFAKNVLMGNVELTEQPDEDMTEFDKDSVLDLLYRREMIID